MTRNKNKDPKDSSPDVKGEEKASMEKENGAGVQVPEQPEKNMQVKLEAKEKEAADLYDKLLRLGAEFDNYKKRMQREKADMARFGCDSLLKGILPVLDNLERAVAHGDKTNGRESLLEGVELIVRQFLNILDRFGVKPIAALGEAFDPERHEAVSEVESEEEPNRVVSEVEKGYMYHDRLLRPAKVLVSKAPAEKIKDSA